MNREQKSATVDEIAAQIGAAEAVFAVDYRGISVAQVAELRSKLRDADARFRIVKNSLSERAADKAGAEDLKPMLVGPTALTLVHGDAALAAKALNDTARQLHLLEFKGGLLNGAVLDADQLRSIARLPAREVLHSQLVGTIAAPLTGLARGLNALIAGIAIQLQAIADQNLVSGEAAPPQAEEPAAAAEPETPAEPEAETATEPEGETAAEPDGETAEPEPEAETAAEPEPEPEQQPSEPEAQAASDAAPASSDKEEA